MHGYAGQIQHSVRASFASPATYEQLDAHNGLATQDPTAIDHDFSTHPRKIASCEELPVGPVVLHEPHVGVSGSSRQGCSASTFRMRAASPLRRSGLRCRLG